MGATPQIAGWLEKLGLSEYAERFAENDIDFAILSDLTDQDVTSLRQAHVAMRRPASSRIWASVARFAAASFSAAAARCASILGRLKPMVRMSRQ